MRPWRCATVAGPPGAVEVVQGDQAALDVHPGAHLGGRADPHAHPPVVHRREQGVSPGLRLVVVDEGHLLGRHTACGQLGADLGVDEAALRAVTEERERRARLREAYGVVQHEDLPEGVRPPILVVYVGELNTLRLDVPEVEKWLTSEMSTVLADGIRFLIDDQNTSGKVTEWRTHIGTYIAGFQASQDGLAEAV